MKGTKSDRLAEKAIFAVSEATSQLTQMLKNDEFLELKADRSINKAVYKVDQWKQQAFGDNYFPDFTRAQEKEVITDDQIFERLANSRDKLNKVLDRCYKKTWIDRVQIK